MCGRYTLATPVTTLVERFGATPRQPFGPRYNCAPGQALPVVTGDDPDRIYLFEWGLVPPWADDRSTAFINARAETVREKPSFRAAFEHRRCLVLTDGFYEWRAPEGRGPKQPYRIARVDDEPFAMAGLWERWTDNGDVLETCTILTTGANETVRPIHDRMPVVFDPDSERGWLSADDPADLRALLRPYGGDDLRAYPISRAVNDPSNDRPGVIDPLGETQSGLGDFGE
jgi:putative SOS response-associated peptidase YedK